MVDPKAPLRRVLVVEDDQDFAESVTDLLEPLGFTVRAVADAAGALDALVTFAAEVALVDLKLGADDGAKLVSALKDRRPSLICILMTAYASVDSAVTALKNGADDYLFKPFEPRALGERVQSAFDDAERLAKAQRDERMFLLGHLCAGVAHDMNNYLQAMLLDVEDGQAALNAAEPLPDLALQCLRSIESAVESSADICHRMLKFAKGVPTSGRADAVRVVRESEPLLRKLIAATVELRVQVDADSLWVACSPTELQQVLMNLVRNAGQAISGRGNITLGISAGSHAGRAGAHIVVSDDGRGISEDVLPRIFDPYFTTQDRQEGTGLGLSTVYGIVRGAGGATLVQSEIGKGSRFDIHLPAAAPPVSRTPPPPVPPAPVSRAARGLLVVDDAPTLLGILERVLRVHGFGMVGVGSAEQALHEFERVHVSLAGAICDLSLPGMSGLQLVNALRQLRPDFPIALTSGEERPLAFEELGPRTTFFRKPYSVRQVIEWFRSVDVAQNDAG